MILNLSPRNATEKEKELGVIDLPDKFQKQLSKLHEFEMPDFDPDFDDFEKDMILSSEIHKKAEKIAQFTVKMMRLNPNIKTNHVLIDAQPALAKELFEHLQIRSLQPVFIINDKNKNPIIIKRFFESFP